MSEKALDTLKADFDLGNANTSFGLMSTWLYASGNIAGEAVSKGAMKIGATLLCLVLTGVMVLHAQQPQFEVATLKLSPPSASDMNAINLGAVRNRH